MMLYGRKALSLALLFLMLLSLFAAFVGGPLLERDDPAEVTDDTPDEDMKGVFEDFRGTRADSENIDLVSRPLYGPARDVHVVGDYAYLVAGASLLIFDISDTSDPTLEGYYDSPTEALGVYVEGNYAYLANSLRGLNIVDISDPSSPESKNIIDTDGTFWDVYVSGSYAYVADPSQGMVIFNITSPENPVQEGDPFPTDGTVYSITVSGNFAYIPSEFEGLLIVNVTYPMNPITEGENDSYAEGCYPRDVFVSEPYAYVADYYNGLVVFDVTNKSDPKALTINVTAGYPWEIKLYGNYAYIADEEEGVAIMNISDPENPGSPIYYPTSSDVYSVFVENGHAFVADRDYGLRILDISGEPPALSEEGSWEGTGYYAFDVDVEEDYAYVAEHEAGLKILDISEPESPSIAGSYDTDGDSIAVDVAGGYAYLAEQGYGLTVIDVNAPSNPNLAWNWEFTGDGSAYDVYISGSYAYIADYNYGLRIIDSNTQNEKGHLQMDGNPSCVQVHNNLAYVGDGTHLRIINVTDPSSPEEEGSYQLIFTPGGSSTMAVHVSGSYAYVTDGFNGLTIIDITDPKSPTFVGNYPGILPTGVLALGSTVYLTDIAAFTALDTSTPSNPQVLGYYDASDFPFAVDVMGSYAYLAGTIGGLYILDISQVADTSPPQVTSNLPANDATGIQLNQSIQITFNENMNHSSVEDAFSITPSISGDFKWSGNSVTFKPNGNLSAATTYTVKILATAKDTAGNTLDGNKNGMEQGSPTDDYSWEFTTVIPPGIESVSPGSGSTNIPVDASIIINFTKGMDRNSVESAFSYTNGPQTWDINDGGVVWSDLDKTFTFTPSSAFDNGIEYQVTLAHTAMDKNGILLDVDEDLIPGEEEDDDYTWEFTTIPLPPRIDSTFPQPGSTLVLINTNIIIDFSKSMDKSKTRDVLSYTFDGTTLYAPNDQVAWSNEDRTMTFTPSGTFQNDRTYTFKIDHTATDAQGAGLDGDNDGIGGEEGEDDYSWSFRTIPKAPQVLTSSLKPRRGATKVPVDSSIEVKFTKEMDETSVENAFSFTYEGSDTTWNVSDGNVSWKNPQTMTFEPSSEFEHDKEYTVRIEATAKDTDGITLVDDYTWTFTTIKEPPEVVSVEPLNNSLDVEIDKNIVITFDRAMNKYSTEKAVSFTHNGTTEVFSISDGTPVWTDGDKTLTFDPDSDLEEGRLYTVSVENTAKDADSITFEGYEWQFTTKANSAPVLVSGGALVEKRNVKFTIFYTDADNDKPTTIKVIIDDEVPWNMDESDRKVKTYTDGKMYEFTIELEPGEHTYYFEAKDEKHDVRYPEGGVTKTVEVSGEEEELILGFLEEKYFDMPTLICGPIAIIILIAIIISMILIVRRRRGAGEEMMTFETFDEGGEAPITFMPEGEEELMTFTSFEEPISLEEAVPVVIQCPECEAYLKVRAAIRPFNFPCKCGATLVLR